jgi:hypothetical protein
VTTTSAPPASAPAEFAAIADHYESLDSAPAKYSANRPASVANGFLVTFAALTLFTMCLMMYLEHTGYITNRRDLALIGGEHINVALPTRMFIIIFFITYALFAYANWWRKLAIAASLLFKLFLALVVIDMIIFLVNQLGWADVTSFGQQVASAMLALCILPHTIMRQATLPDPWWDRVSHEPRGTPTRGSSASSSQPGCSHRFSSSASSRNWSTCGSTRCSAAWDRGCSSFSRSSRF